MRIKAFFKQAFIWDRRAAALVLFCVLPVVAASFFIQPHLAAALLIGLIPAAYTGVLPQRKKRVSILALGLLIAVSLMLGSVIKTTLSALPAAVVMAALGAGVALLSSKFKFARLGNAMAVPIVGIGLSYGSYRVPLEVLGIMVAGSALAWLVSLPFPEYEEPKHPVPPSLIPKKEHFEPMGLYATLYALALAAATLLGYGWDHTGWVVGSVALVMRPLQEMMAFRSVWRIVSVLLGAGVASAVLVLHPAAPLAVGLAALAMMAGGGLHRSKAYIMPAFITYVVFTFLLYPVAASADAWRRFAERVGWVAVGVAIACFFGLLVPRLFVRPKASPPVVG